jgi:ferredoxin-NADP reductase
VPPLLGWQLASVAAIRPETAQVKTFALALPSWQAHQPGQHYDLRLTAEDGYQAQRSYSIASDPTRTGVVELSIERLPDGEVSAFMHDVVVVGDRIEVRGPIGGYFVWSAATGGSLLLIAGGSGIVPLMAMLRHRAAVGSRQPVTLLYSSRSREDAIYFDELQRLAGPDGFSGLNVVHTLTRAQPPGWRGYSRRIDATMLREVLQRTDPRATAFICGPTPLVESAAGTLVDLGFAAARIRTERFGPTGS